ncbi:hypothetical protein [Thermoactinospora rubra]|uniref:hypothetical protein n=1 Tax=Thermoactinospora rubra TaxID=1088767 RepID=UPI0011802E7C|nr:hypothetical protein [Thermoactinospora rubra]
MFLISQQDLQHCGVIALRERRWSKGAAGLTVDQVRADLEVLAERRFVVIDDDTEELLVRSLIRRDKVYAQPNVFKAAAEQIRAVSSPGIKAVLVEELRRLPAGELKGDLRRVYEDLLSDLAEFAGRDSFTPSATPSGRGSPTPSTPPFDPLPETVGQNPDPATQPHHQQPGTPDQEQRGTSGVSAGDKGSRTPSPTPSDQHPSEPRGKGSSYGEQVVVPLSPEPLAVPPPAGAAPPPRDAPPAGEITAQTLIGEWIDHVPKKPPGDVIAQVGKHLKAMLDEGIDPADLRRGLAAWAAKGLHPSTLSSVVNEVMNAVPSRDRHGPGPTRSTTDQRVAEALDVANRLAQREAQHAQGAIP